jgi:5'-nucleotidase
MNFSWTKRVSGRVAGRVSAVWLGLGLFTAVSVAQKPLTVTILHTNDLHAHVEPTAIKGKTYGGYARHATLIQRVRAQEKNVLLLNAGDVFQGTLFFNMYDGLADGMILNAMGYQAQTLGNHEFDRGIPALVDYAKRVNYPLLASNIDMSKEPELAKVVKPYTILEVEKQKIGVVGVITDTTPQITILGDSMKFYAHLASVQKSVDELTKQGVNKIIVMSHIGYDDDKELAAKLKDVDLIIGGHSHTPLGTPALEGWRPAGGEYPTYVKDAKGFSVPIVQAWEWGKVMGRLKLQFDAKGNLSKVLEAEPMVVGPEIPEDPKIAALVDAFRKPIEAMGNAQIGSSEAAVTDRVKVGYWIADSYLAATAKLGVTAAFMNPGGVRANMEAGKVTYGMANAVCPFRNTITIVELTGAKVVTLINESKGGIIPSVGTSFTMAGGSARNVKLGGAALDEAKTYKIAVNNFMAGGGDGLNVLKGAKKLDTGIIDLDAFVEFIKVNSPLKPSNEIRSGR